MSKLKEKYNKKIIPQIKEEFGYKNNLTVPKLEKVTLNVGISSTKRDDKYLELIEKTLTRITGQKPIFTKAKKAISAFKTREGNIVGAKVTLRNNRMYDFVDKLINVSLPRVRDFRGISPKAVDKQGNLNIGFKEHIAFAEIDMSEVEQIHGLEIAITTTAKKYEQGLKLLKLLGFPFQKE
ncbi:50S ribosomal protein L5 [Candidatus Parcubacteria bacterium]|nr:50S ribosomal protein L5 [Patescibacteria group bacterium]MBU4482140.1 50S ribosomal protein L5 [Patescibacteria group bacterium]MCG2687071.1 50S ribosomal protein L5 [Candidatus Parcubacteria bacterium]